MLMFNKKFALISVLTLSFQCAFAQQISSASSSSEASSSAAATPTPPANNLGKWVPPPEVVMPSVDEIVAGVVEDAKKSQFTPEQLDVLKKLYLEKQEAKASPYDTPPNPVIRTIPLDLSPGVTPPVVRLSQGQSTSVVFSDNSGEPWYIESIVMNRKNFSDGRKDGEEAKAAPTNLMTVEPLSPKAYGNVVVKLKGLPTPIIFILTAGQKDVDMRIDAKVPGANPDANAYVQMSNMPSVDASLTLFLDGVPPREAVRLSVIGFPGAEAWVYQKNMYLRINADAQYPAYLAGARSTSGVAVYRYEGKKSQVTVTSGGKAITIHIEKGVQVNE